MHIIKKICIYTIYNYKVKCMKKAMWKERFILC